MPAIRRPAAGAHAGVRPSRHRPEHPHTADAADGAGRRGRRHRRGVRGRTGHHGAATGARQETHPRRRHPVCAARTRRPRRAAARGAGGRLRRLCDRLAARQKHRSSRCRPRRCIWRWCWPSCCPTSRRCSGWPRWCASRRRDGRPGAPPTAASSRSTSRTPRAGTRRSSRAASRCCAAPMAWAEPGRFQYEAAIQSAHCARATQRPRRRRHAAEAAPGAAALGAVAGCGSGGGRGRRRGRRAGCRAAGARCHRRPGRRAISAGVDDSGTSVGRGGAGRGGRRGVSASHRTDVRSRGGRVPLASFARSLPLTGSASDIPG